MAEKSHIKPKKQERKNRVSIMLNDSELHVLQSFCDRYNVSNRSRLIRETLMKAILQKLDQDSPTLFD